MNININGYFHMIPLWKSLIKLPVELPVELPVGATRCGSEPCSESNRHILVLPTRVFGSDAVQAR